jgi:hypothetical protein
MVVPREGLNRTRERFQDLLHCDVTTLNRVDNTLVSVNVQTLCMPKNLKNVADHLNFLPNTFEKHNDIIRIEADTKKDPLLTKRAQ